MPPISDSEFLAWASDRDQALGIYKRDIWTFKPDVIVADLEARYGMIQGKIIHSLIAINACPSCGRSQIVDWGTCESCWEMNDDYFDSLGAIVEEYPIGVGCAGIRGVHIDPEN